MAFNLKNIYPENLLEFPLHDRALDIFQYVLDTYGEENLNEVLKFYDPQNAPDLDKFLITHGVLEMVNEISDDPEAQKGIALILKTFLSMKGTVKAVEYTLRNGGAPETLNIIEWFESEFELNPGEILDDYHGYITVELPLDDYPAPPPTLNDQVQSTIDKFFSLGPYLFPFYLRIYQWCLKKVLQDTNPEPTDGLDMIITMELLDSFCGFTYGSGLTYDGSQLYDTANCITEDFQIEIASELFDQFCQNASAPVYGQCFIYGPVPGHVYGESPAGGYYDDFKGISLVEQGLSDTNRAQTESIGIEVDDTIDSDTNPPQTDDLSNEVIQSISDAVGNGYGQGLTYNGLSNYSDPTKDDLEMEITSGIVNAVNNSGDYGEIIYGQFYYSSGVEYEDNLTVTVTTP